MTDVEDTVMISRKELLDIILSRFVWITPKFHHAQMVDKDEKTINEFCGRISELETINRIIEALPDRHPDFYESDKEKINVEVEFPKTLDEQIQEAQASLDKLMAKKAAAA